MPFIRESIVVTRTAEGGAHVAPLGVIMAGDLLVIAPFIPSRTHDNLRRHGQATVNYVTDPLLFAGLVTGRATAWPCQPATRIAGHRLSAALAHEEVELVRVEGSDERPHFRCRSVHLEAHAPFLGMNRAQAAVLEAAILMTRLTMLEPDKVSRELAYLSIAIDKTAGPAERQAWDWLIDYLDAHRAAALPDA